MSDFAEKHTVARLVGSPPGYVGYGEGGELTSKIETQPASVVLFDEIEKAHPDVLNILLQILEEGELVDAKGQTFDFSKAIIVLTSNLGTDFLHDNEIGFNKAIEGMNDEGTRKYLLNNLKKVLRPELLNRFDEIVVFKKLTKDSQENILQLLLKEVETTLQKQNITLKLNKKATKYLLKEGYSEEYGARALRRVVETKLLDKIAELILHLGETKRSAKSAQLNIAATEQDAQIVVKVIE
jgi:ATP-dependent Clp protease ATP-binding subunit ClpC